MPICFNFSEYISQDTENGNILTKIESENLSLMHNLIDA